LMYREAERGRIIELELQQARYEATLAERRYAACDPDNRLIAAQLERSWEAALRRVAAREARPAAGEEVAAPTAGAPWRPRGRGRPAPRARPPSPASPATWRPLGTRPARPCAPASGSCGPWS